MTSCQYKIVLVLQIFGVAVVVVAVNTTSCLGVTIAQIKTVKLPDLRLFVFFLKTQHCCYGACEIMYCGILIRDCAVS